MGGDLFLNLQLRPEGAMVVLFAGSSRSTYDIIGIGEREHKHLSFIDPERGRFGKILPSVMIFPEGLAPREISSLRVILCRIPRAEVYK